MCAGSPPLHTRMWALAPCVELLVSLQGRTEGVGWCKEADRKCELVTGYRTTSVWCKGGSRYVEGCWGFPYLKINKLLFPTLICMSFCIFHFVGLHFIFCYRIIILCFFIVSFHLISKNVGARMFDNVQQFRSIDLQN